MKLIIAGSRSVTDYEVVRQAVTESGYWKLYKRSIEVVCGMAKGVDLLGKEFARRNDLECWEFPADWDRQGKAAGIFRNIEMGKFSDGLLAIWDGKSKGTEHMIKWARSNNLDSFVYRTDKLARYATVGMKVRTDFSGKWTDHVISAVVKGRQCQSGVMLAVHPPVPKSNGELVDADWFMLY